MAHRRKPFAVRAWPFVAAAYVLFAAGLLMGGIHGRGAFVILPVPALHLLGIALGIAETFSRDAVVRSRAWWAVGLAVGPPIVLGVSAAVFD